MNLFRTSLKARAFALFVLLFGATLVLDYLVFNQLYFYLPNEMEWDTSPWYNFEKKRKDLKADSSPNKVIVTGSSVALYSVLPDVLNRRANGSYNVDFYSHVAMAPSDLYYYKEDIVKTNPKMVMYVLNLADFQWEYVFIENGKFRFEKKLWIDEFADRYPAKLFYPLEFLKDYFFDIGRKKISKLAAKSLFYASRYRVFFWDPIDTYIENHFRSGRSYNKYQGSLPKEGIWSKGWTKLSASMQCDISKKEEDSIFFSRNHSKIKFSFYQTEEDAFKKLPLVHSEERIFSKSGWVGIAWKSFSLPSSQSYFLKLEVLEGDTTAKAADLFRTGKDYPVGVRLSHYFCKEPSYADRSYLREPYYDEVRFTEMTSEEYDEDYFQRMLESADQRNELYRLNVLRQNKKKIGTTKFEAWMEYTRVLEISDYFKEKNIPFVLVLAPENPVESVLYTKSEWFQGMTTHLRTHIESNGQNFHNEVDFSSVKQMFFDPHHMTYDGAYAFQPTLEQIISSSLNR
ncbi:hypothetical protein [Leptospira idonii]|uniref:hypothetical protein n=1 Tax=Leptospira idonii TaxID=1193500 RepID=UPI001FE95A89|nr:hypothetical protein [Leptospira idonii]